MHFESLFSVVIFTILVFAGVASLLGRRHSRRNTPRKSHFGFFRSAALGNALQQLQTIVQPQTKHAIFQMAEEEAEEHSNNPEHPNDPITHLRRQAERIRRGDRIDRITALLAKTK